MAETNENNISKRESRETERRRKSRRRMAYISLLSILVVTYWALFSVPLERLQVLDEVITWFYFVMGSIVGSYVGFATFYDIKTATKHQKDDE